MQEARDILPVAKRTIKKEPLRDQVMPVIRDEIVGGKLKPGTRLDEVRIAAELGVSRTPLREALLGLEREGLVCSEPNKGYTVTPMNADVIRELYPILGALESLALRLFDGDANELAADLRRINDEIHVPKRSCAKLNRLDRAWHESICRACPNQRLTSMIEELKVIARRFDYSLQRGLANVEGSIREHEEIIDAIEAGNLKKASAKLERHWNRGIAVVLRWIAAQQD